MFEGFIQAAILGNTIVLLLQYEGMPDDYKVNGVGRSLCQATHAVGPPA
jgi:ABC-type transporter Mla maintaining outer membrane lipid asymmetry permease subunit MlaE